MLDPNTSRPDRLFLPVTTSVYSWYEAGTKTVEVRRWGGRLNEATAFPGRIVEIRKGYALRDYSKWYVIAAIVVANDPVHLLKKIHYRSVLPMASTFHHAVRTLYELMGAKKGLWVGLMLEPLPLLCLPPIYVWKAICLYPHKGVILSMRPIVKFTGTSCFSFGNNTFPAKVEKSYKISLCKKCQEHELMNSLLKADQGRKKDLSGTTVFLTRVKFLTKRAVLNKMPKKLKKE